MPPPFRRRFSLAFCLSIGCDIILPADPRGVRFARPPLNLVFTTSHAPDVTARSMPSARFCLLDGVYATLICLSMPSHASPMRSAHTPPPLYKIYAFLFASFQAPMLAFFAIRYAAHLH
jgi:hypothetical protein